ncbi:uncharacterized protein LOC116023619 [Ipomoea triloba]|uniref:uncharacterized protein LOC116023619 n=1 Tax=Ipomoea triloba TaxID=35885 RepID=UPI00125CD4B9|nr:uncharacterized protein LOC116023619 [Ipomoea triloba]
MGSSQSVELASEDEEEEEDDDEEGERQGAEEVDGHNSEERRASVGDGSKKVLQQEPEMLPCHASASPLSPQPSALGTPRLGPSIKVWDPFNVLAPAPAPAPAPALSPPSYFPRSFSDEERLVTELILISNGECHMNLRPDLIAGRCPDAALTPNGKRQARALAIFLKSQGVRFAAVYTSPLDRARATALSVCQELNFSEEQIQSSDALVEMSHGHWEGCHRSEIFTSETISLMERFQPDFSAPSGESLRQVEFRMVQFLNGTVMTLPEKFRSDFSPPDRIDGQDFSNRGSHSLTNAVHDRYGPSFSSPQLDLVHRHRQGNTKKKSGKSRLQMVASTGDQADDEMSPRVQANPVAVRDINTKSTYSSVSSSSSSSSSSTCVGIFTHAIPIKCVVTGLLGCSAVMSSKICVDDSSVTVLQHSGKTGWQIKRMNDTSHLRLL